MEKRENKKLDPIIYTVFVEPEFTLENIEYLYI